MTVSFMIGRDGVRDLRFLDGSASLGWKGRAVMKLKQGAIPALPNRFRHDEPEHGANLARSSACSLTHAQNKFCGLTAEIQARIRRCRVSVRREPKV